MKNKRSNKTAAHKMFMSRWNKLDKDRSKVEKTIETSPKGSAGYITAKAKLGGIKNQMDELQADFIETSPKGSKKFSDRGLPRVFNKLRTRPDSIVEEPVEDIPLIKAPKKPNKVPFTGGKAKKTPAVKRFATKGKRGGGMVGRNGIIKGYKKGGQV